jgi:hypothetical protein
VAEIKTKKTVESVIAFLNKVENNEKRADAFKIKEIMEKLTGSAAQMWGSAIVGFGEVKLKYSSGREVEWMICGFSPRKQNLTIYIHEDFPEKQELLAQLGKHQSGKGCIYINRLSDINLLILEKYIAAGIAATINK